MRKFAAATVLSADVGRPDTRLHHTGHRAVFSYVPREGYVYVRSRAISSRCNDNWDYFGPEDIAKSYQTFNGKPVFVNHANSDHRRARGMVVESALHRDRNADGSPDVWVEVLMEVDGRTFPRLAKALLSGDIDRTSMGCDVEISKCSYCGNEATTPLQYCQHIPGKKGKRIFKQLGDGRREGVLVYEICSGLSFFENSLLVEPPADPTAFFLDRPVAGPGLEHLHAKAARLQAAAVEQPAAPRHAPPSHALPSPGLAQRTATRTAAGDVHGQESYKQETCPDCGAQSPEWASECTNCGRCTSCGQHLPHGQSPEQTYAMREPHRAQHMYTGSRNEQNRAQPRTSAQRFQFLGGGQQAAEDYLAAHPIGVHHILNRVAEAASNPHTLHSGMRWYDDAHGMAKTMASHHNVPLSHAAGALGVYSASSAPAPNFHMASMALHAGKGIWAKDRGGDEGHGYRGAPMASQTDADKVSRIFGGEHYSSVIGSSKTKNYAKLIENPNNDHDVVIDRHAVAAAVGHQGNSGEPYNAVAGAMENANKKGGGKIYDRVGDAYRQATDHLNNAPEHADLRAHMRKSGLLGQDEKIKPHHTQALAWIAQKDHSDQHARNNMSSANQKNIDAWQNHYTSRYGVDAHHPVSGKGFYGQEPTAPDASPKAARLMRTAYLRALGYGETTAPQDVDTLRDERCAICGNDIAYDGRECQVCGYLAPPKALGDPDVDKAKNLDALKQSVDDELLAADPSRQGADFDPELPGDGGDDEPELACNNCGTPYEATPPQTIGGGPDPEAGPAEGDVCPTCGEGVLESTGQSPDELAQGEEGEVSDADQAESEVTEDGLPTDGGPNPPDSEDEDDEDQQDAEDDDDQDDDDQRPAPRKAKAAKYRTSSKEFPMQNGLIALAEMQRLSDLQQRQMFVLQQRLDAKDSQVQRLTAGIQAIAQMLGPQADTIVRTAMVRKHADEQNPAQPIPEPAPEPPSESTIEAETPEAFADVRAPGMVPGSTHDVPADAVSTAYTPGQDIPSPAINQLVDVTRPIDGTQGPRPLSEVKTLNDVRVGNPMNPQVAFPVGGDFSNAQRTSSRDVTAAATGDLRFMACMRLARLQLAHGMDSGDDLAIAQKIATSKKNINEINSEIDILNRVQASAAKRNQAPPSRRAVPRSAGNRTVPSLGSAPQPMQRRAARADDDIDLAVALMGDALSVE